MYSKVLSAAAVVLATSNMVTAQTSTSCDPTKKTCPNDPAFAGTFDADLTKGASDLFTNLAGTKVTYDSTHGGIFTINTEADAPTMQSNKYMFFGQVDVTMQAAPGAGIVSSFVLQSDDLDEIDIEFVGADNAQFQSNYFSKGDTTTYDRGAYHPVANPTGQFHTYSLIWTKEQLQWLLDGAVVRTLTYADAKGGATYPQTPMQIKFGTWVAGRKDAPEGTATWAGGYTNFANAPFIGYYKEIKITDNAGGVSGAKQYIWTDHSGTWQSIEVSSSDSGNSTDSSSSSASASASASASQTTMSTVTSASASATAAASTTSGTKTTGTTSATHSATTTAAPNAAGKAGFTIANAALAGLCLVAANFFLL